MNAFSSMLRAVHFITIDHDWFIVSASLSTTCLLHVACIDETLNSRPTFWGLRSNNIRKSIPYTKRRGNQTNQGDKKFLHNDYKNCSPKLKSFRKNGKILLAEFFSMTAQWFLKNKSWKQVAVFFYLSKRALFRNMNGYRSFIHFLNHAFWRWQNSSIFGSRLRREYEP